MIDINRLVWTAEIHAHIHVNAATSEAFYHTHVLDVYTNTEGVTLNGLPDDFIQSPSCEDIAEEVMVKAFERYKDDEPSYSDIMSSPNRISEIYEYFFALDDVKYDDDEYMDFRGEIAREIREKIAERMIQWCEENQLEYIYDKSKQIF